MGTAIFGSLVAAILIADTRLTGQSRRAGERVKACQVADTLLSVWWQDREKLPRNDTGDVPGQRGWRWRTQSRPLGEHGRQTSVNVDVVALEVFAPQQSEAAVSVEVLSPRLDSLETQPSDAR